VVRRTKSLKSIETQIRRLQEKAERLKEEEQRGAKELRAVIAKYKLGPADVRSALKNGAAHQSRPLRLKAKYRNPKNKAQTWAGRGLKPRWLTDLLKQGKKLEEFVIRRTVR
jgi:DNA-binding protein H-NS